MDLSLYVERNKRNKRPNASPRRRLVWNGGGGPGQHCRQFAATFPDEPIVVTLSRQLSWSHFVSLVPLKDPLQRGYYAQMCCAERWSVRTLRGRIDSMLYERTALSRQPDALIAHELATMQDAQCMSPTLVMRDPYILDSV